MVGETSIANANGRVIANTIIRGAINFIEKQKLNIKGLWQALSQTQKFKSWTGYAFESICLNKNILRRDKTWSFPRR